jgi:ubiquinone/menaquinone biosynthesis C-methylase UbiE
MSVATHLGIDLAEYDARIRTFIPHYEEMLEVAAAAINPESRTVVDLGVGTGALSARCLTKAPQAQIVGIDLDAEMLKGAARRLPTSASLLCSSFLEAEIPPCDAVVASFSLHHIEAREAKAKLYRRIAEVLEENGIVLTVDCNPAVDPALALRQFEAWKSHLMEHYTEQEADGYLEAWSHEDFYFSLDTEMELMQGARLSVEVLWRKDAFAVLRGKA